MSAHPQLPTPQVRPITDQPRPRPLPVVELLAAGVLMDKKANTADEETLRGLTALSISNLILIEIETKCFSCNSDAHYVVKNSNKNLIFTAEEELRFCNFGSLQNVLIMDANKKIIARVCYKEKSCVAGAMKIGVYAPPDILLAAIVEVSSCFSKSSHFKISDSEGQKLFEVKYSQGLCSQLCGCPANFKITSEEAKAEVAQIVEKTAQRLSLHFRGKLSVTSKLILTGFCLGLAHKAYKQKPSGTDSSGQD